MWGISLVGAMELIRKENNLGIIRFKDGQPDVHQLMSPDAKTTRAITFSFQKGAAQDNSGNNE